MELVGMLFMLRVRRNPSIYYLGIDIPQVVQLYLLRQCETYGGSRLTLVPPSSNRL
jgi:hypothetical protein